MREQEDMPTLDKGSAEPLKVKGHDRRTPHLHLRRVLGALLPCALVLSACGSSAGHNAPAASGPSTQTASAANSSSPYWANGLHKVSSIAAMLPSSIRKSGSLVNPVADIYPPTMFYAADGKTLIGWEVDLSGALGRVLGLSIRSVGVDFSSIIPGLADGRYEISNAGIDITAAREKQVAFVSNLNDSAGVMVAKQSGFDPTNLISLCGHSVGALLGSVEVASLQSESAQCKSAGKQSIQVKTYPNEAEANLALTSRRVDSVSGDSDTLDYSVTKQPSLFKVTATYGFQPAGMAIAKNATTHEVQQAFLAATNYLIHNGAYLRILKHWGVADTALKHAKAY